MESMLCGLIIMLLSDRTSSCSQLQTMKYFILHHQHNNNLSFLSENKNKYFWWLISTTILLFIVLLKSKQFFLFMWICITGIPASESQYIYPFACNSAYNYIWYMYDLQFCDTCLESGGSRKRIQDWFDWQGVFCLVWWLF